MFIWIFYVAFGSFSHRSKAIIKYVSNILRIVCSITIFKRERERQREKEREGIAGALEDTFLEKLEIWFVSMYSQYYFNLFQNSYYNKTV